MPQSGVITFDATFHNELGLEWIRIPEILGTRSGALCGVVGPIVDIMAKWFRVRCNLIGNIFLSRHVRSAPSQSAESPLLREFVVDKIVSMPLFGGVDHVLQDVPRDPFSSSRIWLTSRLTMAMNDRKRVLEEQADADDVEDAQVTKNLILQLSDYMPKFFPANA